MKKKITIFVACLICVLMIFPINASADMGPKPSVNIIFENMGDDLCYATLLSKDKSTGPASVWDGDETHISDNDLDRSIWKAFVEYEDEDGYYFLQWAWQVNETKEFTWGYYPPEKFKILLYYPKTDVFMVSDVYERYAFDTYYTVDMKGRDILSVTYDDALSSDSRIYLHRSYRYSTEFGALLARGLFTIILEIGVALFFGIRGKKSYLLLVGTNVFTQLLLNIALNAVCNSMGMDAYVVTYILLELLVFAIEAAVYAALLKKYNTKTQKTWLYITYALIANLISFGAGVILPVWIPAIF